MTKSPSIYTSTAISHPQNISACQAHKIGKVKSRVALALAASFLLTACAGPSTNSDNRPEKQVEAKAQNTASEEQIESIQVSSSRASEHELQRISVSEAKLIQNRSKRMNVLNDMASSSQFHAEVDWDSQAINNENYESPNIGSVKLTTQDPVSTFSVDVDTGSYTNTRRMLNQGMLPPTDAIRIEEFINYFDYDYGVPPDMNQPFSVNTDVSSAPWNEQRHLLRVALKGYLPDIADSKGSNLVFLLDVSGSMNQSNKLPLLKRSLLMLSKQLQANDKVAIVVYAGASGVVLEPTNGNNRAEIEKALMQLQAGGSTNGGAVIQLAYNLAEQSYIQGGVNRVILATDGDFNVGMSDHDALISMIEKKREKGIALTTLGFGQGNYNDHLMEQLADAGNGNYAYIDTINEARKVLVDELQSTMQIIAKDVKVQVEFNPATVAEYRLIGYENRALANEDFNNDEVDAGDIGAGHTVTALYEISLQSSSSKYNSALRYTDGAENENKTLAELGNELAYVKLRYKAPNSDTSNLIETAVTKDKIVAFQQQSTDFKFAVAVSAFAQRLKESKFASDISYPWIIETAMENKGRDDFGYRNEFLQLVRNAQQLAEQTMPPANLDKANENMNEQVYSQLRN
ncbi:VWA domain-containing protein [Glaciecola sp. MH2013]|uniref:vWA domain-containing protein n=1 Tax=Glaciecola sp. MH2013 TaxID=2785524 RepID=UPI00189DCF25|nr:VWA domain-containing protein [Glaciecola sp. MH2013]MBF7073340.1 VWA domain-containing protein [Glaciecola sp. MH2013]